MGASQERDVRLAGLAAGQHGMFTSADLAWLGFTRGEAVARRRSGRWEAVAPGVWRLAGAPPSWRATLWAAAAWAGPNAAVSHRAAAALHGFDNFPPCPPELSVPRDDRGRRTRWAMHTTEALPRRDVVTVDGIRVTSATRTVIDLAALDLPAARLGDAIDSAVRLGSSSPAVLRRRIGELRGRGRAGVRVLDSLLLDTGGHTRLERAFLAIVREAGLPRPRCQVVHRDGGRTIARVDFEWTQRRTVAEVSGQRGHASEAERAKDARRQNELQQHGFVVLEFTTSQVFGDRRYVVATLTLRLGR